MEAHLLSINKFSRPLVYDKINAEYINIMYLLYTAKGKYQSHPDMGVSLREKYRYATDESVLHTLKEDIKNQLKIYLPQIKFTDVNIVLQNNILGIIIDTVEGSYILAYDKDKDEMDTGAKYILNNL